MLELRVSVYSLPSCWLESECLSTTALLTVRVSPYPLPSCWLWQWAPIHYCHVDFDSELLFTTVMLSVRVSVSPLYFSTLRHVLQIKFKMIRFYHRYFVLIYISNTFPRAMGEEGGGPRVVASTAAFHARVRGSVPGLGGLKETKNVSFPSTWESQYCEEPQWPRGSVLGLRPPGLEFRVLCLEDSVISIISPSSGCFPVPV